MKKKTEKKVEERVEEVNKVARIMKVMSPIMLVAGIITGVIMFIDMFYNWERIDLAFVSIILLSIVASIIMYAIGEIIQKLHNIENNLKNK